MTQALMSRAQGRGGPQTKGSTRARLRSTFAFCLLAIAACSDPPPEAEDVAFTSAIRQLTDAYGDDQKADFLGIKDPCELLEPIFEFGEDALRSGFFIGVQGSGTLVGLQGLGGFDIVWDYHNAQITVSSYLGNGYNFTGGSNVTAAAYVGWVTGFERGVSDWDGRHYQVAAEIGLPFLKDYLHLHPEAFIIPKDVTGDDYVGLEDLRLNGSGLFGFSIGVALGFELLPDPLPVGLEVSQGVWRPHEAGINMLYQRLKAQRLIPVIGEPLAVTLVDHLTGEPCDESAHSEVEESEVEESAHKECVIQLGDPSWSHTRNALHVAASLCAVSGGCATPLAWPQSALALAIGAWRDRLKSSDGDLGVCSAR